MKDHSYVKISKILNKYTMKKNILIVIALWVIALFTTAVGFDVNIDEPNSDDQRTWYNRDVSGSFKFSNFSNFEWQYWSYGNWSPVNATCGTRSRTRTISGCYVSWTNQKIANADEVAACGSPKPGPETEEEDLWECYDGEWIVNPPRACNTSCGQSARTNNWSISCVWTSCNPADRPTNVASISCPQTPSCTTACDAGWVASYRLNDTNVWAYLEHEWIYSHPVNRCVKNLTYKVTRRQASDWPGIGTVYGSLEDYPTSWVRTVFNESSGPNSLSFSVSQAWNPNNCGSGYKWIHSLNFIIHDYSPSTGGVYGDLTWDSTIKYTGCTAPVQWCPAKTILGHAVQAGPDKDVQTFAGNSVFATFTCDDITWKWTIENICGNKFQNCQ